MSTQEEMKEEEKAEEDDEPEGVSDAQ